MLISPQRTLLLYIYVWQTATAWKAHCVSLSLSRMELIQETHCRLFILNSYVVDPVLHELEYSNVCRIDVCLEVILTLLFCSEVQAVSCFNASLLRRNAQKGYANGEYLSEEVVSQVRLCLRPNMPSIIAVYKNGHTLSLVQKTADALSLNRSGIVSNTCVASNRKYQTIIRRTNEISFFVQIKIHTKQSITFWKYFHPFKLMRGHSLGNL